MTALVSFSAEELHSQAEQATKNQAKPQEDEVAAWIVEVCPGDSCCEWGGENTQSAELEGPVDVHIHGIC